MNNEVKSNQTDWFKLNGKEMVDVQNLVSVYENILTTDGLDKKTIYSILFDDVRYDENFDISDKKLRKMIEKQSERFLNIRMSLIQQWLEFSNKKN